MLESATKQITITQYTYSVFHKLVQFIYFDEVEVSPDDATDLLRAADEYMLERLKVLCEEVIVEAVTEENVAQLLEAAESYRARHLRAACIGFLAGRPAILPLPPTIQSDLRVLL